MTVTTLPIFPIVRLAISDEASDVVERNNLLEDYLLSTVNELTTVPESFKFNDLAVAAFGNQYPSSYYQVRDFIFRTQRDLKLANKDLLSTGLALVFDEGLELKEACSKVHTSYRSGGAYLMSRKLLFMLLLTKSVEFRMFLRNQVDLDGRQRYDVPHNLEQKYNRITDAMLAA